MITDIELMAAYVRIIRQQRLELKQLRAENENLLGQIEQLETDLDFAESVIEDYEDEEDAELDALVDKAFDEMMLEAQL